MTLRVSLPVVHNVKSIEASVHRADGKSWISLTFKDDSGHQQSLAAFGMSFEESTALADSINNAAAPVTVTA